MIRIDNDKISKAQGPCVYILFGFEAVQARPNLDPYTSTLRMDDETGQVYTSDVHIKHHARRGIKKFALQENHPAFSAYNDENRDGIIFYEKKDEEGSSRSFTKRLEALRKAHKLGKRDKEEAKKDAVRYGLDAPLFGYVHAVSQENYNLTNAANTLFRPVTFHECSIVQLGRNNAFPGESKESSGSASIDSLEYGFFLALWEVHLNALRVNAETHALVDWSQYGANAWLDLLVNGLWRAYTIDRYPSFTQRPQFAQFLTAWTPQVDGLQYTSPQDLYVRLDKKLIKQHDDAIEALKNILPGYLKEWNCNDETRLCLQVADTAKQLF